MVGVSSRCEAQGAGGFGVPVVKADTAAVAEVPDDGPAIAEIPASPRPVARLLFPQPARPAVPSVRQQIDPDDNIERVLILAPGGPIVVQATIFVDGRPFRQLRERLVEELLKQADTDKDGKATWEEALRNPRFGFGRYSQASQQAEQQRQAFLRQFDQNGDGLADRYEARMVISQFGGGSEFQVPSFPTVTPQPDVRRVLDADGDGMISVDELAAATERLKSRDANDNDLVESAELGAAAVASARSFVRGNQPVAPGSVFPLGASVNYAAIRSALLGRYGRDGKLVAESFPLFPTLLDSLDRNANGEVDEAELPLFNSMRPHIAAIVQLGEKEPVKPGIQITWLCREFQSREALGAAAADRVTAVLPGVKLVLGAAAFQGRTYNYRQAAQQMLAQYDLDKNAYIEKKELDEQPNKQYLLQQFDRWDENGDGKVYVEEILADYDRQIAPQRSQITLSAGDRGASLFAALDQSGDNRLSLREMRTAAERLKTFDADRDGRLSAAEIPTEIVVTVAQGPNYGFQGGGFAVVRADGTAGTASQTPAVAAPKWFQSMDRNGDGDITPREFLGTPEQFQQLDRNGDGFIEPSEARQPVPPARS